MVENVPLRPSGARRGFAWIELLNFIWLASTLAALAMYGLGRYIRHAKTAEAVGSLAAIGQAAAAYYDESDSTQPTGAPESAVRAMRHFPPPSRASVPPDLADIRGKRYQSTLADWQPSPWRELHFSIPQPQCYAYSFDSTGTGPQASATATARGDLNGDGVLSTYRLGIALDGKQSARVSPNLLRTNGEE
jgi:type II secretory pathway pseudopilin PulG